MLKQGCFKVVLIETFESKLLQAKILHTWLGKNLENAVANREACQEIQYHIHKLFITK